MEKKEIYSMIQKAMDLVNEGRPVEAVKIMEKAASYNYNIPNLHFIRAKCLEIVGRNEEALNALKKELEINPDNSDAKKQIEYFDNALLRPKFIKIPLEQRAWNTSLPYDTLMSIQKATHNYTYKGIPMIKNPFDFALYPHLIWNVKPKTIIEIGSKNGGSAVWFGDIFNNYCIDGHIYSLDIFRVNDVFHPRVTFMEADGRNLAGTVTEDFINSLQRPLLVIEDADHSYETSISVLNFFHNYLHSEEYIVIEDGIISDIGKDKTFSSGPHRALKEFLSEHKDEYEIDSEYCDFFGYNCTWATNGFLKKLVNVNYKAAITENNFFEAEREKDVKELVENAIFHLNSENNLFAIELFDSIIKKNQKYIELNYGKAIAYARMGEKIKAVNLLKELLDKSPKHKNSALLLDALKEDLEKNGYSENKNSKIVPEKIKENNMISLQTRISDPDFVEIINEIKEYTTISENKLYSLYSITKRICEENIPGNFIEYDIEGIGTAVFIGLVIKKFTKQIRWVYCFQLMQIPTIERKEKSENIVNNCFDSEENISKLCKKTGISDIVHTIKLDFPEKLSEIKNRVGVISLLHINGYGYESTSTIINNLYDRIVNGGFIQIDDYGYCEGCKKAVDEFFEKKNLSFIPNIIDETGCWFIKPDKYPVNINIQPKIIADFEKDDVLKDGILSQMSLNERFQLYYLVNKYFSPKEKKFRFTEIGSFSGASLLLIYRALLRRKINFEGFSVEPGGTEQFFQVIKELSGRITHLGAFSYEAADVLKKHFIKDGNYPEFIFIDGDHSYEGVYYDIEKYFPLLEQGGIMLFHDFLPPLNDENRESVFFHHAGNEPGIRRACTELMEKKYNCSLIELPLLYPDDPAQTQAHLPVIPEVFSTIRAYRKPG